MALGVMLCCNDPANGSFVGKAEFIEVEDINMSGPEVVVAHYDRQVKSAKAHEGEQALRVGRIVVPCLGYKTWAGNWCWDRASIRSIHARRIVNYLMSRRWHCEEAPSDLYEVINAGEPITGSLWKKLMAEGN